MGNMRDYLDQRKAAKNDPPQTVHPPEAPESPKAPKPPQSKEADPKLVVSYQCGHKIGVAHFKQRKCPACVAQQRREKNAKNQEARQQKQAKRHDEQRLPDESRFEFTYYTELKQWRGMLMIGADAEITFSVEASAVMKLPPLLDKQYREWVRLKHQETENE